MSTRNWRLRRGADWFLRRLNSVWGFVPLTVFGAVSALAAFGAWKFFGQQELDLVLLVVGLGGLAIIGTAALITTLTSAYVYLRLRSRSGSWTGASIERQTFETERWEKTGFHLRTLSLLPWMRLKWTIEAPSTTQVRLTRARGWTHEEALASHRGLYAETARRIHIEDVFGLTRMSQRWRFPQATQVLPHRGKLRTFAQLASLAPGGDHSHALGELSGDRIDLRRYSAGDPARWIHWKAFGRTRKLIVRTPERAVRDIDRTLIYLVTGTNDEPAAAMARTLVEEMTGDWTFGVDGSAHDASTVPDALNLIATSHRPGGRRGGTGRTLTTAVRWMRSLSQRPFTQKSRAKNASNADHQVGLKEFLTRNSKLGPSSLLLCIPPALGSRATELLEACARCQGTIRLCVVVDNLHRESPSGWLRRLVYYDAKENRAATHATIRHTFRELESLLPDTVVIDRMKGVTLRPNDLLR